MNVANVELLAGALDNLAHALVDEEGGWGHHAIATFMFRCLAGDEALGGSLRRACDRFARLPAARRPPSGERQAGGERTVAFVADWEMHHEHHKA